MKKSENLDMMIAVIQVLEPNEHVQSNGYKDLLGKSETDPYARLILTSVNPIDCKFAFVLEKMI